MNRIFVILFLLNSYFGAAVRSEETPSPPVSGRGEGQQQECETSAGIFWPVCTTLALVILALLVSYLFWRYYWNVRHGKHLVLVTDLEKGDVEYAFDNPGFREGTPVFKKKSKDDKKTKWITFNEKVNNGQPKSLNDSTPQKADQRTNVVALKSHDFTGLGFNICGNMRDGIYVKDMLHHGPALESGNIKPGDRIAAIRINFSHMVYDDALAILSYASPYEVEVEIENNKTWSPGSMKSTSISSDHINHPFYRSQSFSDIHEIQKIQSKSPLTSGVENTTTSPQPAILEVSTVSERIPKYGGVKVLPDIKTDSFGTVNAERQRKSPAYVQENNMTFEPANNAISVFDEVDLGPKIDAANDNSNEKPTTGQTKEVNVKSIIVKGIQNIKDKINTHMQKNSYEKESQVHKGQNEENTANGKTKNEELRENPSMVAFKGDRKRKDSTDSCEFDDSNSLMTSKRKAPLPPQNSSIEYNKKFSMEGSLLNEIDKEVNKNFDTEDSTGSGTIELDSSHVTVHHNPEESRKAASLGDLSKIADGDSSLTLERAVSLELAETTPHGTRKRKAPMPPQEDNFSDDIPFKDPEPVLNTKLKKSSLFGTMEKALRQSDDNLSILSIPTDDSLIASTPLKTRENKSADTSSNNSWELNFDTHDEKDCDVFLDPIEDMEEKIPELPTSPIPNLSSYITEITVTNNAQDKKINKSDGTMFITAVESSASETINESDRSISDSSFQPEQNKTQNTFEEIKYYDIDEPENYNKNNENHSFDKPALKSKVSHDHNESNKTTCENQNQSRDDLNVTATSEHEYKNATEEQIANNNHNSSDGTNLKYAKMNGGETPNKTKSPQSKLPKLNTTSPTNKIAGSRIPVRANTEPSLKLPLAIKEANTVKNRKTKHLDDDVVKSVTFSHPIPTPRKNLSPIHYNGSSRESTMTQIVLENRK